jgi:hypothetical protein
MKTLASRVRARGAMPRTVVWLAAVVAFTLTGIAAHAAPPVGLRLGVTGGRLHGSIGDEVASDHRPGFDLALWTRAPISGAFSFQPELQWITKGGQGDFQIGIADAHAEFSLQYIEAPMLLRAELPAAGAWAPFIVLGPTVGWRVDSHVDLETDPIVMPAASPEVSIFEGVGTFGDPEFSDWDFGVLGGAGVTLGRGRTRVTLEARYQRGFVNLYDSDDAEATTGTFAATIGLELR